MRPKPAIATGHTPGQCDIPACGIEGATFHLQTFTVTIAGRTGHRHITPGQGFPVHLNPDTLRAFPCDVQITRAVCRQVRQHIHSDTVS